MQDQVCYEKYPAGIVIVSNLLTLSIYAAGAYLMYNIGLPWLVLYILFIILLEIRLLSRHCLDCYYYGKACAFGRGRISSMIFPKGDPERFCRNNYSLKDIVPDFLLILVPVIAGAISLVFEFRWNTLVIIIAIIILGFPVTGALRMKLACRHCRQRETGCPSLELFGGDPS